MEIELKYRVDNIEQYNHILTDSWLHELSETDKPEVVRMKAAYFDTANHDLLRHNIAFRIRSEGRRTLATLKWNDDDEGINGLYIRSEINIPVTDETCFFAPDPEIFKESNEGKDLIGVIGGKPLINIFDMIFTRKRKRIDYEESILEVSLDEGVIVAGEKSANFRELEIEIYSGSKDDLLVVGKTLADRYALEPESRTKFARGVELLTNS